MGRPKKDPADKASIRVTVKLTPHQAKVLDGVREDDGRMRSAAPLSRPEFLRDLLKQRYAQKVKYGMPEIKREQGGTDG